MSALAIAACSPKSTEADGPTATADGLRDCASYVDSKYRNHEAEVCTAYVANSAEVALQGFYKFGNNRRSYLYDPARHHFETRYWGGPRQAIEREVDGWPTTKSFFGNKVKERVGVVSVSSNLKADRGLVRTRESWTVTSPTGQVLHREGSHIRNVTMCRGKLPGHVLHEWMVVKYQRDPNFNCIAFDRRHDIKP